MSSIPTCIKDGVTMCKIVYADMSVVGYAPSPKHIWYYKYVIAENKLYTWYEVIWDSNQLWYEVITNGVFQDKDGDPIEAFYGE